VLAFLAHVAFGGGDGFSEVFANKINGEAGPCGKVAGVDGFEPSGGNQAEASSMKLSHDVLFDCEFVNVVGGWLVVGLVDKLGSLGQGAWL
jgi:hypothetical protein